MWLFYFLFWIAVRANATPVSKPTLSLWCELEMTYCVLTCNGDTTGAEPVTYWWTSGDKTWSSTKEHKITKEDSELWFSCAFKNPVSSSSSEIVFNPFMEKKTLYGKTGDKAVLTPDSVENPIYTIKWTHGPYFAIEWLRYGDETHSYRQFKDRGSLDISTGALTITGLTPDDSGNYTVEINNKVTSKTELLVISPVSKPTLSLLCEPEMTYCVLTCNGDTTGAEPVTYRWTSGDTTLSSTKEHKITKENKELWFSCALKNPVSFNSSEKVFNPFIRDWTWIYIVIAVFTLVMCIIIIIIIKFRRKRRERAAVGVCQEVQEMSDKDEAVYMSYQERQERSDKGEATERRLQVLLASRQGEATERRLQVLLASRQGAAVGVCQEMLKRLREGAAQGMCQDFLEMSDEGAAETRWKGAAQGMCHDFLEMSDEGEDDESD